MDTVEKDEANARAREEREARLRCEKELANSRLAYEMLSNELTDMRKKHDRQRALKARYKPFSLSSVTLVIMRTCLTNDCYYSFDAE